MNMIYDKLVHLSHYKGLTQNLDKAIDFILATDLSALPVGKTVIDGEEVFVNVMEITTKASDEGEFEAHQKYLDIQLDLEGEEYIEMALERGDVIEPYNEENDYGFFKSGEALSCLLGKERFMICMTDELHKPGIQVNESMAVKKCVVKVKWDN
jgi:YhcH/YjgK/YiaL family protein